MRDETVTLRRGKKTRLYPPKISYKKLNKDKPSRRSSRLNKKSVKFNDNVEIIQIQKVVKKNNVTKAKAKEQTTQLRRSSRLKNKNIKHVPKEGYMFNNEINNQKEISNIPNWSDWIAATDTKNYLMDDGFLDLLQYKSANVIKESPQYAKEIGKMISSSTNVKGFVSSLLSYGNMFETKIISLLKKELGENNTIDIQGNHNARSEQKYKNTISAIQKGVPLIFQGILRNYENKTYGVSDIIIRSDWINKFLDVNALSREEISIPAPKLKQNYHYIIIDIKYKCLPLRSDGIHLRNDSNLKAYKSQLWVYNEALSKIQGYTSPYAFILGSKWKYTCKGNNFEGKSCFERLGKIDYINLDKSYIEKTELAINWLNDVKKNDYDMSKYPLPRDEMYPNMCNRHDYPYHNIKKKFAENNNDITLLWNVGPKQRRIANSNGVWNWKDPNCTPENLGVTGKIKSKVIGRILEANHSEIRNIHPKYISHNYEDWKNTEGRNIELFVDFETTCSVFNGLDDLPNNYSHNLIFLIGAGYICPKTNKWIFKEFTVNQINESEENRICCEFVNFINQLAQTYQIKDSIPCYHYSSAEKTSWNNFLKRNNKNYEIDWVDLLKVFLEEPIGVKGALNYSLKTIAKTFYNHGYIQTIWDNNLSCVDGADAAVGAFRANLECLQKGISFQKHDLTQDIIKYNEVDCKTLQEILFYLRENHVEEMESIDSDSIELFDDSIESIDDSYEENHTYKKRKI